MKITKKHLRKLIKEQTTDPIVNALVKNLRMVTGLQTNRIDPFLLECIYILAKIMFKSPFNSAKFQKFKKLMEINFNAEKSKIKKSNDDDNEDGAFVSI